MNFSTICYSGEDFVFHVPSLVEQKSATDSGIQSKFENILQNKWNHAVQNGYCRYKLGHLESKQLEGKFKFLCKMNEKRGSERRAPQKMTSIRMDFNHEDFHFNKVKPEEILICLQPNWCKGSEDHFILINASPLEYGNCLLVPYMKDCHSQVLQYDGLRLVIETVLLSTDKSLRAGFNSLTALASVNHCHFHLYYLKCNLYIETAKVINLYKDCHVFVDYPANGFVFQVTEPEDIEKITNSVMKLVNYLLKNSIAHSVYLTRGTIFGEENVDHYKALRICIWAREAVFGVKSTKAFIPACIELAGHIPLKNQDLFDTLTESDVISELKRTCNNKFTQVKEVIEKIYLND